MDETLNNETSTIEVVTDNEVTTETINENTDVNENLNNLTKEQLLEMLNQFKTDSKNEVLTEIAEQEKLKNMTDDERKAYEAEKEKDALKAELEQLKQEAFKNTALTALAKAGLDESLSDLICKNSTTKDEILTNVTNVSNVINNIVNQKIEAILNEKLKNSTMHPSVGSNHVTDNFEAFKTAMDNRDTEYISTLQARNPALFNQLMQQYMSNLI